VALNTLQRLKTKVFDKYLQRLKKTKYLSSGDVLVAI
jgi:hypothetical protein